MSDSTVCVYFYRKEPEKKEKKKIVCIVYLLSKSCLFSKDTIK